MSENTGGHAMTGEGRGPYKAQGDFVRGVKGYGLASAATMGDAERFAAELNRLHAAASKLGRLVDAMRMADLMNAREEWDAVQADPLAREYATTKGGA